MTKENIIKMHKHFSKLAAGDFTARDFDTETPGKNEGDEDGNMRMGKLTPQRISLVKSTALTNKLEMEQKTCKINDVEVLSYPYLTEKTKTEKPKK